MVTGILFQEEKLSGKEKPVGGGVGGNGEVRYHIERGEESPEFNPMEGRSTGGIICGADAEGTHTQYGRALPWRRSVDGRGG